MSKVYQMLRAKKVNCSVTKKGLRLNKSNHVNKICLKTLANYDSFIRAFIYAITQSASSNQDGEGLLEVDDNGGELYLEAGYPAEEGSDDGSKESSSDSAESIIRVNASPGAVTKKGLINPSGTPSLRTEGDSGINLDLMAVVTQLFIALQISVIFKGK